jgi:hypothetical protein
MKKQAVLLPFLVLISSCMVYGQENFATNIEKRIVQGEIVFISFEVLPSPDEKTFNVLLVPEIGGEKIRVSEAYGDIGKNILPGKREIVWYFKSDFDGDISNVVFNVYAYEEEKPGALTRLISEPSSNYKRHKTMKNIWLGAAVTTGALGGYSLIRSASLYNEYPTATENAEEIRKKFQTLDIIAPIAIVLSGVSVSQVIIQSKKQKKAEQNISFHLLPVNEGAVLGLTWKF